MRFRAGDLVTVATDLGDRIDLYDTPPGPSGVMCDVVSFLQAGEPALVISLDRSDARCVYVVGPHGPGWAFGAYLRHA